MQDNVTKQYRIGGLVWELTGPAVEDPEKMEIFRCEGQEPDCRVNMTVTETPALPSLPQIHQDAFARYYGQGHLKGRVDYLNYDAAILFAEQEEGNQRWVEYAASAMQYYSYKVALHILDIPHQVLRYGGVFLHASYILADGKAILFTAPKQTGKSTQAALWEKHREAAVINGDRALLRRVNGVWQVFGSPYCGTSEICKNHQAPIRAVVVLGQARENRIARASVREAMAAFLNGCTYATWDRTQVETVMDLAGQIITEVPIIKLDCVPDESAVRALEEFLWELETK